MQLSCDVKSRQRRVVLAQLLFNTAFVNPSGYVSVCSAANASPQRDAACIELTSQAYRVGFVGVAMRLLMLPEHTVYHEYAVMGD